LPPLTVVLNFLVPDERLLFEIVQSADMAVACQDQAVELGVAEAAVFPKRQRMILTVADFRRHLSQGKLPPGTDILVGRYLSGKLRGLGFRNLAHAEKYPGYLLAGRKPPPMTEVSSTSSRAKPKRRQNRRR
jgi:hypothetical protein